MQLVAFIALRAHFRRDDFALGKGMIRRESEPKTAMKGLIHELSFQHFRTAFPTHLRPQLKFAGVKNDDGPGWNYGAITSASFGVDDVRRRRTGILYIDLGLEPEYSWTRLAP